MKQLFREFTTKHFLIIEEFVFEMRCGMNEFDHRILALLKQQRERPKKFRPERGFKPEILLAKNIMQMSSTSLGSIPGSTTEICGGILGDGWDSLSEGRGNSRHCFYDQRLGMGEFKSL